MNKRFLLGIRQSVLWSLLHWFLIPFVAVGMVLWPTFSSQLSQLQVDPGDTLLNLYFLEHAFRHFTSSALLQAERYWSPDFFWPIEKTLAWSDHLLGQSVIYSAFRFLLDPFESYLAWLAATLWLNYASIRQAARLISPTSRPIWISLAALVTSFSPAVIQQLNHPQLLSLYLVGPLLVACHRLISEKPERFLIADWLILASYLMANGFFNVYIFVYASYGVLVCAALHLFRRIRARSIALKAGKQLLRNLSIFVACLGLNIAIYVPYLETLKTFGKRPLQEVVVNLPRPASWILGSPQWLLSPPLTPDQVPSGWVSGVEQELFPGWALCSLLVAAFLTALWSLRLKDHPLNRWLLVVLVMVLGSLCIDGISLWPFIAKALPGAISLRASSRVGMVIILFAAPSIALASAHWKLPLHWIYESIAGSLLITGGFVGIWSVHPPSFSLAEWRREVDALTVSLNASDCGLFWYEWRDQAPWRAQVIAMHVQQNTGIPTANGYSGHFPKEAWPFERSQGDRALSWIQSSQPGRFHSLKPMTSRARWCIATLDESKHARIRSYDPNFVTRFQSDWIDYPNVIILEHDGFSIGQKYGHLYINDRKGTYPGKWLLLDRGGVAVPADRGDFKIVALDFQRQSGQSRVLVTDRNPVQRIEYVWLINPATGEFISQQMRFIDYR